MSDISEGGGEMTKRKLCPYAKSDMTPCVLRDGDICWAFGFGDAPICVGCERSPRTLGVPAPKPWPPKLAKETGK